MDNINIHKKISDDFTLSIESLKIDPGLNFVIGPNGSGKSTLLKELVETKISGDQCFYLPAENEIDLDLSLGELCELLDTSLPLSLRAFSSELNKKLRFFSSGQRQRLVINLVSQLENKANIYLDEPTNYLDPLYKFEFMDTLNESSKNYLISTNDFSWCIQFFTANAILLSNGTISRQGPLIEVIESEEMQNAFQMKFHVKKELNSKLLQLAVDR